MCHRTHAYKLMYISGTIVFSVQISIAFYII